MGSKTQERRGDRTGAFGDPTRSMRRGGTLRPRRSVARRRSPALRESACLPKPPPSPRLRRTSRRRQRRVLEHCSGLGMRRRASSQSGDESPHCVVGVTGGWPSSATAMTECTMMWARPTRAVDRTSLRPRTGAPRCATSVPSWLHLPATSSRDQALGQPPEAGLTVRLRSLLRLTRMSSAGDCALQRRFPCRGTWSVVRQRPDAHGDHEPFSEGRGKAAPPNEPVQGGPRLARAAS